MKLIKSHRSSPVISDNYLERSNNESYNISAKLRKIFDFLKREKHFNCQTQHMHYAQCIGGWNDNGSKLRSLLYSTAETQTRGSLNRLAETWKRLHANKDKFNKVSTVLDLVEALKLLEKPSNSVSSEPRKPLDAMWHSLAKAEGFGAKTAALFVKAIVDIHTLDVNKSLHFLEDFAIDSADTFRVPVDSVIIHIFHCITGKNLHSDAINQLIHNSGLRDETKPTIWDDLWFWGFITQHRGGEDRELVINEAKFWSIPGSPKEQWNQVEIAAQEFVDILKSPAS